MSPLVSVGMPVRNGADYLDGAIASLVNQTVHDIEIVISDNGSSDATEQICRAWASSDDRIRYVRQDGNKGAARNYNEVLRLASAPYFTWAAHDDVRAPTALERCVVALEETDAVLAYPKTLLLDADGSAVGVYDDRLELREPSPSRRLAHLVRTLDLCNPVFGLVRTDVLRSTRMHGDYPSADRVLLAELALRGTIVEVGDPLFGRRFHANTSRSAHSLRSVSAWFDPGRRGPLSPRLRLFRGYMQAVSEAPLSGAERRKAYVALAAAWPARIGSRALQRVRTRSAVPGGGVASAIAGRWSRRDRVASAG